MIEQICSKPEIYRIPVELPQNPLRSLNSYVIKTSGHSMVIDTGFNRPECHEALWSGIKELSLNLEQTSLFLTHLHSDHSGLAWDFVNAGCKVYMSKIDYEYFTASMERETWWSTMEAQYHREGYPLKELALQSKGNQARQYAAERVFPVTTMEDLDEIRLDDVRIQCIHTPGHTPGHMVLYLPEEQLLFAGDHILFDITPNIGVWKDVPHSLSDYINSLQKIRALPIKTAFPGHRNWRDDVYARIDQIIEHHDRRLDEIYQTVKAKSGITAFEVAGSIRWSARGIPWREFLPNQKWFAMSETLAHLYYLTDKGQVTRCTSGDVITYHA